MLFKKCVTRYFTLLITLFLLSFPSYACVLKMGYRTTARLPNIAAAPNNEGVYYDLYQQAAQRVGCELVIYRLPKNRILRDLMKGKLDFYPALTFTEGRSSSLLFVENGLPSHRVGLTRKALPNISNYAQLAGRTVLIGLGSAKEKAEKYNLTIKSPTELSIQSAIEYIADGNVDFYEDEISTLFYYLKSYPRANELRYHHYCCATDGHLKLAFSRASVHIKEQKNPDYQPDSPLSATNFPQKMDQNSIAYRFQKALADLAREGVTEQIFAKHYGISSQSIFLSQQGPIPMLYRWN